jgi:hypothetical protein
MELAEWGMIGAMDVPHSAVLDTGHCIGAVPAPNTARHRIAAMLGFCLS